MPTDLYEAHLQWAKRPPDERFPDMEAILEFTGKRKHNASEEVRPLKGTRLYASRGGALNLNGRSPQALLTNWSFSQLCQRVGAPAGYLRTLPAEMTAQCLEHGLIMATGECKVLMRNSDQPGKEDPINLASAFTSPTYGRIWDYDVLTELIEAISNSGWHTPPYAYDEYSGLYASDRDMFIFLINDEEPIEVEESRLSKGFFCWNSETGAATFGLTTFLYNHICGNHIVWGAEQIEELRIIHRNRALDRFYKEAVPALNHFVENRLLTDRIKDSLARAHKQIIGQSLDDILKWSGSQPLTRSEVAKAWQQSNVDGGNGMSMWSMVQGLTAIARNYLHADKRVDLEKRAGALLH
ncbi:conserved hypothetical protein [Candidatus Zixiibacteriota bacterium]|nr:conserved hypothetical protein [candidate division Zixibacteria bacterium]